MKLTLRDWCQGCIATMLLWCATMLHAQPGISLSEDRAKVAYVLNFIRLVDWPENAFADASAPLILCVLGRNERVMSMSVLHGRLVNGRRLMVQRKDRPEGMEGCHVLYISRSEERHAALALHQLAGRAVLTVSEIGGFIDLGGAIGLVRNEERLEFEVNREALLRARLTASSHLLKLARNLRRWQ